VGLGGVPGADGVGADDLVVRVDAQEARIGHVCGTYVVEHFDGVAFHQEAMHHAVGISEGADNIACVVNAGRHHAHRVKNACIRDIAECAIPYVKLIAMVVPVAVCIEANCDAVVVEAKQLVHLDTIGCSSVRVFEGGKFPPGSFRSQSKACLNQRGNVTVNVEPDPSWLSTLIRPLWAFTTPSTMASPNPLLFPSVRLRA
jgi:hypothetical protein